MQLLLWRAAWAYPQTTPWRQSAWWLLSWLWLGALLGAAQSNEQQLCGKVLLPNGKTAAGVLMGLWQSGALAAQAVTTHCGDFSFNKLTPAKHQVIVKYLGYQPAEETATLSPVGAIKPAQLPLIEIRLPDFNQRNHHHLQPQPKLFDQAEQQLQKALSLSGGKRLAVHLNLAEVYEAKGEKQAVIRALERYLKQQPNAPKAPAIRAAITRLSQ